MSALARSRPLAAHGAAHVLRGRARQPLAVDRAS